MRGLLKWGSVRTNKKNINKIVWSFLSGLFKWGSVRTNKENQWNCLDSPTQQGTMCNGLKRLGLMLPLLRIAGAEISFKRDFELTTVS